MVTIFWYEKMLRVNLTRVFNFVSVFWGVVLLKTAWHGTAPHLLPARVVCLIVPCRLLDSVPLRSFWFPHLHHHCNSMPTDLEVWLCSWLGLFNEILLLALWLQQNITAFTVTLYGRGTTGMRMMLHGLPYEQQEKLKTSATQMLRSY